MSAQNNGLRHVSLPRSRLLKLAELLLQQHESRARKLAVATKDKQVPLTVVCTSDTHNRQPSLPEGDILLHAGDFTENGSFSEIQAQLQWLNSQPHKHKVVIAGNHDVRLDEDFLNDHPERRYGESNIRHDLNWGSIIYLQDSSTVFNLGDRTVKIYGSPKTPRYGISAFQHAPDQDIWSGRLTNGYDIVLTHGPPRLHLDKVPHAGCAYLGCEIARAKPRLVVFEHIHVGHGVEEVRYDRVRQAYEAVEVGWSNWGGLLEMFFWGLLYRLMGLFGPVKAGKVTTLVNASLVGGSKNEIRNEAIVVEI